MYYFGEQMGDNRCRAHQFDTAWTARIHSLRSTQLLPNHLSAFAYAGSRLPARRDGISVPLVPAYCGTPSNQLLCYVYMHRNVSNLFMHNNFIKFLGIFPGIKESPG